ncbi:hypothetical protein Enr13x_21790 [Stieleria neptunia]|uniref:FG-GAP repeat protein n=1 Tax=Stieleria neptunia TaxID=2527979 RepID=A0A518HN96_9BACT|nr:VCBS repeat-containing protein [Stieleria neptunia]QDV42334.1 hypothetical protein Enr13x_21790 [Stieleria neptunia]
MNTIVFLDLNFNQQIDVGEPTATLNAEGLYEFVEMDAHVSYSILATLPTGFQQVAPDADGNFEWEIFLPAGGDVTNRNFGFRRVQATGQSTSSIVSGRLFEDTNGSGLFEQGIEVSHGNVPIYLDANNNRRHNIGSDEPITLTNADGTFAIDGLSSQIVTLRTSLNDRFVHTTPLGNSFDLETSRLFSGVVAFDTASAATPSDFNLDGIADLAVANVSQNTLSILAGRADGVIIRETAHPIGTGEKGIDSMDVADIDNDGDLDIVATRLSDGGVSIFRNITDTTADPVHIQFEPLESFGVAQASVFERAPIVLANFDNDVSGPGGEGTVDIVAIPKSTATVNVMMNSLVDGGHRVALDGLNTISDLDFIITPTGDVVPPSVTDVRIAASGWATSFKSAVDPQNLRGAIVPGPSPLRPLSWHGLDTLFVEFSEDIQKATDGIIDAADLTLVGANVPDYKSASGIGITTSYTDGGGDGPFLLTIQLAGSANFEADRIVLGLSDSIVDLAGNPLGGNSIFGFNVLPGDVDGSGGVLANDVLMVNASQFTFAGAVGYDAFRDIDGSGAVFANDVLLANGRQFTFLPPESPAAPPTLDPGSVDEFFESITSDGEGELAAETGIKLFCNSEPNA